MLFLRKDNANSWVANKFQHKSKLMFIGRKYLKSYQEGVQSYIQAQVKSEILLIADATRGL